MLHIVEHGIKLHGMAQVNADGLINPLCSGIVRLHERLNGL